MTSHKLLALVSCCAALLISACGKNPEVAKPTKSPAASLAETTIQSYFSPSPSDPARWLAVEQRGATDRMNGVAERYTLVFECSQWRAWDGNWGQWNQGTQGKASGLVNALIPSGASGYASFRLELTNGTWAVRNLSPHHNFVADKAVVQALADKAGFR
jgi:hypothetical protein